MFYEYRQNNSGGSFDYTPARGISHFVIIEAASADEADKKAERLGIYFNGRNTGMDCPCCGDRWHPASEDDATELPSHYDTPVKEGDPRPANSYRWMDGAEGFIHYAKGNKPLPFWP